MEGDSMEPSREPPVRAVEQHIGAVVVRLSGALEARLRRCTARCAPARDAAHARSQWARSAPTGARFGRRCARFLQRVIRRARPDESETLLRIQREAAVTAFAHIFPPDRYPFPSDAVHADWQSALVDPELEIYVIEIDGEPAGSVAIVHGFLRNLYVLPEHQGSGVGSTLHD